MDTGVDFSHQFLKNHKVNNLIEVLNNFDDDNNGFVDDLYGWNFYDNNRIIFDNREMPDLSMEIIRYKEIAAKIRLNSASEQEIKWYKKKKKDKPFKNKLRIYNSHAHGSHVAGIAVKKNPNARILAIKFLKVKTAITNNVDLDAPFRLRVNLGQIEEEINKQALKSLVRLEKTTAYLFQKKVRVANGSYGMSSVGADKDIKRIFNQVLNRDPTDEEKLHFRQEYFTILFDGADEIIRAYPKILFVFSAGNKKKDNDRNYHYPSNIRLNNVISVAAANADRLSRTSNYGKNNVDIAAPGVAILSSVPSKTRPNNKFLASSGTSMAAPFVSNIAAQILDINSSLSSLAVKKIILGTVDKKGYLKNKLQSGGIINSRRALQAAYNSKRYSVPKAIRLACQNVADNDYSKTRVDEKQIEFIDEQELPSPM